jgi:hypothetical protein
MKSRLKLGILIALGLSLGLVNSTSGSEKWQSLFNGSDLSGWVVKCKPQDASKRFWSVDWTPWIKVDTTTCGCSLKKSSPTLCCV